MVGVRCGRRVGAALLVLGLTAACGTSDDTAEVSTDTASASTDTAAGDTGAGETERGAADAVDIDALSDDEFAGYLLGLSDAEFEEFTADLDDEEYDELIDFLERYDGGDTAPAADGGADSDGDGTGAADDGSDAAPEPTAASQSRDDVDCSGEGLGADDTFAYTTAHYVVDGALGEVCLGEPDERLTQAWDALATITPQGQLTDLGVFTGIESREDGDEVTLAFVSALDADGSLFQMAVNLDAYVDDPAEAQLTLAHEFSHVFTALPAQIDRSAEAEDDCTTYFNGEGCYLDDSIMNQWIEEFWADGLIDQVDPFADATGADGQERCDADPGFFGAYAASTPEEDFAESFSVYVFDVETFSDEQQARIDWIAAQPGLSEFRERAENAGLTGLPNQFDECGLG